MTRSVDLSLSTEFEAIFLQGPPKVYGALREDILEFIKQAQERVLSHQEEQALLKAYIAEWRKFFTQCSYLPMPFGQLESAMQVRVSSDQIICHVMAPYQYSN